MLVRKRKLAIIFAITVIMISGFLAPPVHASTSYNSNPNTALAVDYNADYNQGQTLGEYGSSTGFDHVEPRTEQTANFYVGVMAHTILWGSENGAGIRNLHITMVGNYPDGSLLDGLHMVADQPIEGPNGASNTADPLMSIIKAALGTAFSAYGIPSDILYLSTYSQSTPQEYGRDSYDVYADWTCATNNCLNQLGDSYLFQDASLKDSFHLNVDPNKQGTYFLQFIYHADFVYCSHTGQYKGATLCDGWNDLTQDYIDNILYCYVKCSSNGAGFVAQTPSNTPTVSATLSQTTYLDSLNPTNTYGTSDPIYMGILNGQHQNPLFGFSLPNLPSNSYVINAYLQFYVSAINPYPFLAQCDSSGGGCHISVAQISSQWSSSSATWNNPPPTSASEAAHWGMGLGTSDIDITKLIQSAYSSGNFYGLEISPTTSTDNWQAAVISGQKTTPAPSLSITYTTYTSPPSTMCTGQSASVTITMRNSAIDSNGNVLSLSNWYPASLGVANPFVLESENPEGNTNWGATSIALTQPVLYGQSYTFNFNAVAPLVPGTYNFQWRMAQLGIGSFGDYTPNLVVNVQPCGDFAISANSFTVAVGQTGTSTVSLSGLSGFAGQVSLSDTVPTGLSCNPINPTNVILPPSPATATVSCSSNTLGSYPVTVTGTIGSLTHSTTFTATIIAPDFTISANPMTLPPDSATTSSITVQTQPNAQGVTFSFSSTLGILSSTTCTTGSTGLCVITIKSGQVGSATISATAPSYPSHQVTVTFVGSLAVSSNTNTAPATITVQTSNNQPNVVISFTTTFGTLSAPSCTTGSGGACSVTISSNAPGSATVTATAPYYNSGSTTLTIPAITLSAGPSSLPADGSTTSTITAQLTNNAQGITISFTTTGGTLSATSCVTSSTGSCTITIKSNTAGVFTVTVTAPNYANGQTNVSFFDFAISTNPLAIDGSNESLCTSTNNACSTTISTASQNDIIIAYTFDSVDTRTSCTFSIGDTAGLTWNLRTNVYGRYDSTTGGYRDQIAEFWARSSTKLSSDTITETIGGPNTGTCPTNVYGSELDGLLVFGVSGANYNNPFDPNISLPGATSGNSNKPYAAISTTNPNDLVISGVLQSGFSQTTLGPAYGFSIISWTPGSCGSLARGTNTAAQFEFAGLQLSSFPVSFSDCNPGWWELIADAIQPSPSSVVNVGLSATSSIILNSDNGFSGTVSLSDAVPAGLSCGSITPTSLSVGPYYPSVATLTCTSNTAGSYPVTITGTSGTLKRTNTLTVTFNDFSLAVSPSPFTVLGASSGSATVYVNNLYGFAGTVSLSLSASSSTGPSCSLNPTSVVLTTTTSATSTLSCSGYGTNTITVTGSSNGLTRYATVTVTIQDFSSQVSTNPITVNAGSTGTLTITVTSLGGYSGSISFSAYGPWCISTSFNPSSVLLKPGGSNTTTLNITPQGPCSGFQSGITIYETGSSAIGGIQHSLSITVTVPGFTIAVSQSGQTIPAGRSGSYTVTLTSLYGYSGTVALSTVSLPSCVGSSFQTGTVTLASGGTVSTTMTLTPGGTCPANNLYAYVYGQDSSKGITVNTSFNLIISSFQASINYPTIGVKPGATAYYTVTVTNLNGYPSSSIYVGFSSSVPCLTMLSWNNELTLPSSGSVSTQIAYTTTSNCATPQSFTITNYAQDNAYPSVTSSASIQVTVGYFTLSSSPTSLTVYQGSSGTESLNIYPYYGSTDTLSLTASGIPSCASATFNPTSISMPNGGSSSLTISSGSCSVSSYTITVTAQGPTTSQSTSFTLSITTPPCGCGGGGGSVAYGSLVTLADGSQIPVQDLKVGDVMLGYDPTTGQFTTSTVLSIKAVSTTNMLIIHTQSGVPFRVDANPRQTLWVKTPDGKTQWLSVTLIQPGDDLLTPTGWTTVTSIEFAPAGQHTMFDIVATMPYFTDNYLDPIRKM